MQDHGAGSQEPGHRGPRRFFLPTGETAEVDVNPVLTSREQQGGPLPSIAGLMRFYRSEDRVVMVDSVRINQDQTRARADTAVAYGQEHLVLTGAPEVSMAETSMMKGDRIEFFYLDGQLRRVMLVGNGRMEDAAPDSLAGIYEGLPELDVLEGDSITVEFEDEKIARTVVVGNARSQFTPQDLTDEVATNDVTGDTIIINFRDQQVKRVKVLGNAVGNYRFAKIAAMREMLGRSQAPGGQLARSGADSVAAADTLAATGGHAVPRSPSADSPAHRGPGFPGRRRFRHHRQSGMDFLATAQQVKYAGGEVIFEMADQTMDIQGRGLPGVRHHEADRRPHQAGHRPNGNSMPRATPWWRTPRASSATAWATISSTRPRRSKAASRPWTTTTTPATASGASPTRP